MTKVCTIPDCVRPVTARTWCAAHYRRWHKYGDPQAVAPPRAVAPLGTSKTCLRCGVEQDRAQFPQGWSPCFDCRAKSHYSTGKTCQDCGKPIANSTVTNLCREHWGALRRKQATPKRRIVGGYVLLTAQYDHPNARQRGHLFEHIKVMTEMLGRPLRAGENVHHINGTKDDNRPENLELWSTSQPKGQRVVDKVAWAKEILAAYEPEALSIEPERMSIVRGV